MRVPAGCGGSGVGRAKADWGCLAFVVPGLGIVFPRRGLGSDCISARSGREAGASVAFSLCGWTGVGCEVRMTRWYATLALWDALYGTGLPLGGRASRPMDQGSLLFSTLDMQILSAFSPLLSSHSLTSAGSDTPYQSRRVPLRTRSRKPASPRGDPLAFPCPSPPQPNLHPIYAVSRPPSIPPELR